MSDKYTVQEFASALRQKYPKTGSKVENDTVLVNSFVHQNPKYRDYIDYDFSFLDKKEESGTILKSDDRPENIRPYEVRDLPLPDESSNKQKGPYFPEEKTQGNADLLGNQTLKTDVSKEDPGADQEQLREDSKVISRDPVDAFDKIMEDRGTSGIEQTRNMMQGPYYPTQAEQVYKENETGIERARKRLEEMDPEMFEGKLEEYLEIAEPLLKMSTKERNALMFGKDKAFAEKTRKAYEVSQAHNDFMNAYKPVLKEEVGAIYNSEQPKIREQIEQYKQYKHKPASEKVNTPYGLKTIATPGSDEQKREKRNFDYADQLLSQTDRLMKAIDSSTAGESVKGFVSPIKEDFLTFNWNKVFRDVKLAQIINKAEKEGRHMLTDGEDALLEALALHTTVHAAGLTNMGYDVTKGMAEMIPFMAWFAITRTPSDAMAKTIQKSLGGLSKNAIAKMAGKQGMNMAAKTMDDMSKFLVYHAKYLPTATMLPGTYSAAAEHRRGNVDMVDSPFGIMTRMPQNRPSVIESAGVGLITGAAEIWGERLFSDFFRIGSKKLGQTLARDASVGERFVSNLKEQVKWSGTPLEYIEENYTSLWQEGILHDQWEWTGAREQLTLFLTIAGVGGAFSGMNALSGSIGRDDQKIDQAKVKIGREKARDILVRSFDEDTLLKVNAISELSPQEQIDAVEILSRQNKLNGIQIGHIVNYLFYTNAYNGMSESMSVEQIEQIDKAVDDAMNMDVDYTHDDGSVKKGTYNGDPVVIIKGQLTDGAVIIEKANGDTEMVSPKDIEDLEEISIEQEIQNIAEEKSKETSGKLTDEEIGKQASDEMGKNLLPGMIIEINGEQGEVLPPGYDPDTGVVILFGETPKNVLPDELGEVSIIDQKEPEKIETGPVLEIDDERFELLPVGKDTWRVTRGTQSDAQKIADQLQADYEMLEFSIEKVPSKDPFKKAEFDVVARVRQADQNFTEINQDIPAGQENNEMPEQGSVDQPIGSGVQNGSDAIERVPVIGIGDLHGENPAMLANDFEKAGITRNGQWVTNYAVVQIGDVTDRGEYSLELINYLDELQKDPQNTLVRILGNHDLFHIMGQAERIKAQSNPEITERLRQAVLEKRILAAFTEGDVLYTHAGIDLSKLPELKGKSNKEIVQELNDRLFNAVENNDFSDPIFSQDGIFWTRSNIENDQFRQVVGHTVKNKEHTYQDGDRVKYIDTGRIFGGDRTFFENTVVPKEDNNNQPEKPDSSGIEQSTKADALKDIERIASMEKPGELLKEMGLPSYVVSFFNSLKKSDVTPFTWSVYGKGFVPKLGWKIREFFFNVWKRNTGLTSFENFEISNVEKASDIRTILLKNGIYLHIATGQYKGDNTFYAGTQVNIQYVIQRKLQELVDSGVISQQEAHDIYDKLAETQLQKEETKVNPDPSEAQKEAGNYQKGHVRVQGMEITIENPKGSVRSGRDAQGNPWEITLNNTYGYFKRSKGKDGDQIDVFLGDNLDSEKVFIIDQVNEDGSFDEHKTMLSFDSAEQASEAYLSNYTPGWQGLGNITETTIESFKEWLGNGTRKRKPAAEYTKFKQESESKGSDDFDWDDLFNQPEPTPEEKAKLEAELQADEEARREKLYQESNISKKWAPTYKVAIQKYTDNYNTAKANKEKWEAKQYKKHGGSVDVGTHNDFDHNVVSIDGINEKRRERAISGHKAEMQEAIEGLDELARILKLSKDEKAAIMPNQKQEQPKPEAEYTKFKQVSEFPKEQPRQEPITQKVEGVETNREFANNVSAPGKLTVIEADQLQPSHKNRKRNPLHGIAEAQPKERNDQASDLESTRIANNPVWEKLSNKTLDVYHGAPTVNARGEVIQGNNRSEALLKYWEKDDPRGLRQYLIENASELGIDPSSVREIRKPVLVNMVEVDDDTAIRLGQYTANDLETGGIRRITPKETLRKLSPDNKRRFVQIITEDASPDDTIRESIRKNAVPALRYLLGKKAINETQFQSAIKEGKVRKEAMSDLEDLLKYNIFVGADADFDQYFEKLPYRVQNALMKTAHLTPGDPNNSLNPFIQKATRYYNEYMSASSNGQSMTPAQWEKMVDMFTGLSPEKRYDIASRKLGGIFIDARTEKEIIRKIKQYYSMVNGLEGDLFPVDPVSMEEALQKTLNFTENLDDETTRKVETGRPSEDERGGVDSDSETSSKGRRSSDTASLPDETSQDKAADRRGEEGIALETNLKKDDTLNSTGDPDGDSRKDENRDKGDIPESGRRKQGPAEGDAGVLIEGQGNPPPEGGAGSMGSTPPVVGTRSDARSEFAGDFIGKGSELPGNDGDERGRDVQAGSGKGFEYADTRNAVLSKEEKRGIQQKAEDVPVVISDMNNIAETLPYLFPEQHVDVLKAEQRFFTGAGKDNETGKGILFTNGTGTGKTLSGMGIIKRFAKDGKGEILIVVPNDKKMNDWIEEGQNLFVQINGLQNTKDSGKGIVVTTYANIRINDAAQNKEWDLVVYDEAHKINANKAGDGTRQYWAHLETSKMPNEAKQRATVEILGEAPHHLNRANALMSDDRTKVKDRLPKALEWVEGRMRRLESINTPAAQQSLRIYQGQLDHLRRGMTPAEVEVIGWHDSVKENKKAIDERSREIHARTKVLFLSATPFSYDKNIIFADGALWDIYNTFDRREGTGRNDPYAVFMIKNFGYQFKYNRLERPETGVDRNLMERMFFENMVRQGVIHGRQLDVPYDYSRDFILFESETGKLIDQGIKALWDRKELRNLRDYIEKRWDYLRKTQLIESLKAHLSLDRIQQHLDTGRKVVVFHNYKTQDPFHPFIITNEELQEIKLKEIELKALSKTFGNTEIKEEDLISYQYETFKNDYPEVMGLPLDNLGNPIETIKKRFPNALFFNGDVPKSDRKKNTKLFQDDNSGYDLIVIQKDAGKEGISLHDEWGNRQRVLINLGLPTTPTDAIQTEGRIYRLGQKSNAIFEYAVIHTNFERNIYADKVATRTGTAENLSMGNLARGLKNSFVEGYLSAGMKPLNEQGTGQKEIDRSLAALSQWDEAKTLYFSRQKRNQQTKSREGKDYFATPEPLGLKMVEWLHLEPNESALEPSAGHGAIARWFPERTTSKYIEPSYELRSDLSINAKGEIAGSDFEDYHISNKFDGIAMNPPFGTGGKTAVDHVQKAYRHLRAGGRLVAIVPQGQGAQRMEKFMYEEDEKGRQVHPDLNLVSVISLPESTFKRAGTGVRTSIYVIDKLPEGAQAIPTRNVELSGDINELFDRLENLDMPDRQVASDPVQEIHDMMSGKTSKLPNKDVMPGTGKEYAGDYLNQTGVFEYTLQENTRTGDPMHSVVMNERTTKQEWKDALKSAKGIDPKAYWSKYSGNGIRPGFVFSNEDTAREFVRKMNAPETGESYVHFKITPKSNLQGSMFDTPGFLGDGKKEKPRRLSEGEFWTVQRKYSMDRNFSFMGSDKIRSVDDVAFLFKSLEKASVENVFFVYEQENGNPVVQHSSMGTPFASTVYLASVADGIKRFNAKKVYMVHNHPSGNLRPSSADREIMKRLSGFFGDIIQDGIIINVDTGKYSTFDHDYGYGSMDNNVLPKDGKKHRVYKFDRQIYRRDVKVSQISSSRDVAEFLTSYRFSTGEKESMLVLDRKNTIVGNFAVTSETTEDKAREISEKVVRYGGTGVILYGRMKDRSASVNAMNKMLSMIDIRILDVISFDSVPDLNYQSMMDKGLLREPYNEKEQYKALTATQRMYADDLIKNYEARMTSAEADYEQSVRRLNAKKKEFGGKMQTTMFGEKQPSLFDVSPDPGIIEKALIPYRDNVESARRRMKELADGKEKYINEVLRGQQGQQELMFKVGDKEGYNYHARENWTAEELRKVNQRAEKQFGLTIDAREAGFIMPDGSMLDFSGKKEGMQSGVKNYDHSKIQEALQGTDLKNFSARNLVMNGRVDMAPQYGMYAFMDMGNIRITGNNIELRHEPTAKQYEVIEMAMREYDEVYTDIQGDNLKTTGAEVVNEIKRYYTPERIPGMIDEMIRKGIHTREDLINFVRFNDPWANFKLGGSRIYNNAEMAMLQSKMSRGTKNQWRAELLKNGSKPYELEWKNFDQLEDRVYDRAEIEQWNRENKVEVEVVVKGITEGATKDEYTFEAEKRDNELKDISSRWRYLETVEYNGHELNERDREQLAEWEKDYGSWMDIEDYHRPAIAENPDSYEPDLEGDTKYKQFTIAEGENYQEWLLTMPGNYKSSHWDEKGVLVHVRMSDFTTKDEKRVLTLHEIQSDWAQDGRREGFVKDKEKIKKEIETKKTELEQFDKKNNLQDLRQNEEKFNRRMFDKYGTGWGVDNYSKLTPKEKAEQSEHERQISEITKSEERNALQQEVLRLEIALESTVGVSRMPFPKTPQWVGLAMRHVIEYAVDSGYDGVAWGTGKQMADMFGLRKQINEITSKRDRNGNIDLDIQYKGENVPLVRKTYTEDELPNVVGKELSEKIISDLNAEKYNFPARKSNVYAGLDLEVGGEGMKGFYDKIVPGWVNKNLKRFGIKSVMTDIDTNPDVLPGGLNLITGEVGTKDKSDYKSVHYFPVNDQLHEEVSQGQPMFGTRKAFGRNYNRVKIVIESMNARVQNYNPYIIVQSQDEITESMKQLGEEKAVISKVEKSMDDTIHAFLSPSGIVYYISDNMPDNAQGISEVWIHEQGVHAGLRALIPNARERKRLTRKVYDSVGEERFKQEMGAAYKSYKDEPEWVKGEEYLASIAEKMDSDQLLDPVEKDIWKKMLGWVNDLLSKIYRFAVKLTDNDLKNIIKASVQTLHYGNMHNTPSGSSVRFSKTEGKGQKRTIIYNPIDPGKWGYFVRGIQDRYRPLKILEQAIKKRGGDVPEWADVYLFENTSRSLSKHQIEQFMEHEWRDLIKAVAVLSKKSSWDAISHYMIAKHAPERNFYLEIAFDVKDGSGMSDKEAAAVVAEFEGNYSKEEIDNFWAAKQAATDFTLEKGLQSGLISKDAYDVYKERYKYYVPLRSWESPRPEEVYDYVNNDLSGSGYNPLRKKAKGRSTLSDHPIPFIGSMAHSAIVEGNKNLVKQRLLNLARLNPQMKDLIQLEKTWWVFDGQQWNQTTKKPIQELWDKGWVRQKRSMDHYLYNTYNLAKQHEIKVTENGQDYIVILNDPLVVQPFNYSIDPFTEWIQKTWLARYTRALGKWHTSENPAFILPNMIRDIRFATTLSLAEKGPGYTRKIMKNYPVSHGAIVRSIRGKEDMSNKSDRMYREWIEHGGPTGYVHMWDIKQFKREIERDVKALQKPHMDLFKIARVESKMMENLARWSEDITRFSVYLTAREQGMSILESIRESKDASTNFDRKGKWSGILGSLYNFFNSNIQGIERIIRMYRKAPLTATALSAYIMAKGYMIAYMLDVLGGDDEEGIPIYDKVSDYLKHRYSVYSIPGSDIYVTIPQAHGMRMWNAFGWIAYDLQSGRKSPAEAFPWIVDATSDSFTPVDIGGLVNSEGYPSVRPLVPSGLSPVYEIMTNENFASFPITKEPYTQGQDYIPNSHRHFKNVNKAAKGFTRELFRLGGGDPDIPNKYYFKDGELHKVHPWLDVNPAHIDHLMSNLMGGKGQFYNQMLKMTLNTVDAATEQLKEDRELKRTLEDHYHAMDLPVLNRWIRQPMSDPLRRWYYEEIGETGNWTNTLRLYENAMKNEKSDEMRNSAEYENIYRKKLIHATIQDLMELEQELRQNEISEPEEMLDVHKLRQKNLKRLADLEKHLTMNNLPGLEKVRELRDEFLETSADPEKVQEQYRKLMKEIIDKPQLR